MGTILLTGATGLIGGAVLYHGLLRDDCRRWRCLVRCRDVETGRQRVAARLARFTDPVAAEALAWRVEIVPGDVTRADRDDDPRLDGVTHVLHLAADTSWWSDDTVHRTNHDGTLALARRAARMPKLERFLHVGTAMICGGEPPRVVREDDYPQAEARHLVGYTASKARAELSLSALFPDLPLVVARPSIVMGHTTLGARPSSSILWLVRAADRLRLLPCDPGVSVDIVPADWVAAVLYGLLVKPGLAHPVYHLSAGEDFCSRWPCVSGIFAAADPAGGLRTIERYDPIGDRHLLKARFAACFGLDTALKRTMLRAFQSYARFWALDVVFDNARILAEGFAPPTPLAGYLAACLATSDDIVAQFADDLDMFASPATAPRRRVVSRRAIAAPPVLPALRHAVNA